MADSQNSAWQRLTALWQSHRSKAKGILVGVALSVGIGMLLLKTSLGDGFVSKSYDLPFQWRAAITNTGEQAVLIYLDDSSHTRLGQKYTQAWDRGFYARLLKRLKAENAAAVVFDVVFSDQSDPKTDKEFADAMRDGGNEILAVDWVPTDYGVAGGKMYKKLERPYQLFDESAADIGADNFFPDEDLSVRRYMPVIHDSALKDVANTNGNLFSEAWAAAVLVNAPVTKDPKMSSGPFWINYYGPEASLSAVSFYKALAENDPDVPRGFFSNKVVFVGEKLYTQLQAARKDEYPSPFSYLAENKFYSGVSIHATAFLNLVRGDWLRRFSYVGERILIIAFGVVFGAGLVFCRPVVATIIALASVFPIVGADYLLLQHDFWFAWLIPVAAQIPIALVWSVAFNSVQLLIEKEKVEQSLRLYLSPKLVKKFASDPALLKPGAKKQLLTILFSDIAGFTTISEGMDSDDLARLMNQYFQTAVHNCIHSTDGTVVKYIGDAIFAFWNAPDPQGDHPYRACEAALLFRDQAKHRINGQELVTRIGLHTGVANVGNFGSESRVDYTAIGENINLASRMEGLNKYLGTRVLLTGETKEGIGERLVTRYLGLFRLKGFEKAVPVYELVDRAVAETKSRDLRQRFAEALDLLSKKDFDAARAAFHCVLKLNPEDGPSEFYLEQIEELCSIALPPDWKGEITLKDK